MPLERAEVDSDPIADPYGVDFWMQDADTRAASGIEHFDEFLERAAKEAPEHKLITIDDVFGRFPGRRRG